MYNKSGYPLKKITKPFLPEAHLILLYFTRMRDVHDYFDSNRLTHVPRALLRKVGERSDSIVVNGDNKQLPRWWEVGAMQ